MIAILKGIGVVLVTLFLFAVSQAKAAMPDLEGAELRQQGVCTYNDDAFPCAVYEKEGVKYLLYAYNGKLIMIYRLKAGATPPYGPDDSDLIWSLRDTSKDI